MVGDNDAGGVATYSQAGQNYGTSLLWVLLLLIPVLVVNQEMVVRLGAVTGRRPRPADQRALRSLLGLVLGRRPVRAQLPDDRHRVHRRQPRARLLRGLRSTSRCRSPPCALVAITVTGSFRAWERSMFVFVFANLLVIPLFFMAHPHGGQRRPRLRRPRHPGWRQLHLGAADHRDRRHDGGAVAAVLPAVEHHRQAHHARAGSTTSGSTRGSARSSSSIGAAALICISAFAFGGTPYFGHFTDAGVTAAGAGPHGSARRRGRSSRSSC